MKVFIIILSYIFSFISFYLLLSVFGWLVSNCSYAQVLRTEGWIGIYTLFIGSWTAGLVAHEIACLYKWYFKRIGF